MKRGRSGASIGLTILAAACNEAAPLRTAFRADLALRHIETQLAFGPRIPGTEAHARTGAWIVQQLGTWADTVLEQHWEHVTAGGEVLPMRNILARFAPDEPTRILYVAHWDTRPVSDAEAEAAQRARPVPGANDGASGVALLLEVARALARVPPPHGVDLLFVDGEDYGDFHADTDVLIGSRHFARHPPEPSYRPRFGVVWDMVAGRRLQLFQEGHSVKHAPGVVAHVWAVADSMGYASVFAQRRGPNVIDDHLPLLEVGWPVVNVIDVGYSSHHTVRDDLGQLSARSLQAVGDVALSLLYAPLPAAP